MADGEKDASITSANMSRGDGFDPANATDDELMSGNCLFVKNRYDRLLEEGHEEAAEEVRQAGTVASMAGVSARLCREHGVDLY